MYGDLLVHGPVCIDCIVCIVCIVYIVYIVYVVYIVGVPEFQNPEFQAATAESGVDKDAENRSFFDEERTFLVATAKLSA